MCETLEISRSAYNKWTKRTETKQEKEDKELAQRILIVYEAYHKTPGYRMMTDIVNKEYKSDYKEKKVYRIMKVLDIQSITRKKKKKYRKTEPEITAENILARDFNASKPNEKWVTDVSEFKAMDGKKVYLSAILDLYDRSIVSHVLGLRNNNKLVFDTFEKAVIKNKTKGLIFHSDRGFQYTSPSFKAKLSRQTMIQSMSRPGRCIDNAPIEGYFGILKCEMYFCRKFKDQNELIKAIDKYIHFYNYNRPQRRYNKQSPMEVRAAAFKSKSSIEQYSIAKNNKIINFRKMIEQKQVKYAII